jgi:hypothetical protein
MENAPVVVISALNIASEAEERFDKWYDAAYGPIFIKNTGTKAIDRYRLIQKSPELPGTLNIYHHENLNRLKERSGNPDRTALVNDQQQGWPIDWYWRSIYTLLRSFRQPAFLTSKSQDTTVDGAPVIYIEGYRLPPEINEQYFNWFARWASRLYVPQLLKGTGARCINFFRLVDYRMPLWDNVRHLEPELPLFVSIAYFENVKDYEEYRTGLEYAIFKRSLDVEFSGGLEFVWDYGYQSLKAYRS